MRTTQDTEVILASAPELTALAQTKDSSALADAADGGFGDANMEELDFEGCIQEGVTLATRAMELGEHEIWELKLDSCVLYFIGSYDTVMNRIRHISE